MKRILEEIQFKQIKHSLYFKKIHNRLKPFNPNKMFLYNRNSVNNIFIFITLIDLLFSNANQFSSYATNTSQIRFKQYNFESSIKNFEMWLFNNVRTAVNFTSVH